MIADWVALAKNPEMENQLKDTTWTWWLAHAFSFFLGRKCYLITHWGMTVIKVVSSNSTMSRLGTMNSTSWVIIRFAKSSHIHINLDSSQCENKLPWFTRHLAWSMRYIFTGRLVGQTRHNCNKFLCRCHFIYFYAKHLLNGKLYCKFDFLNYIWNSSGRSWQCIMFWWGVFPS